MHKPSAIFSPPQHVVSEADGLYTVLSDTPGVTYSFINYCLNLNDHFLPFDEVQRQANQQEHEQQSSHDQQGDLPAAQKG